MTEPTTRDGNRERTRNPLRRKTPESPPQPKGWNVEPAPDGRGGPPPERHDRPLRRYGLPLLVLSIVLLALNWYTASRVAGPAERVRIPYSPLFLDQVEAGNVASITTVGSAVQGDFKSAVTYPTTGKDKRSSKRFETELPVFANGDELSQMLRSEKVTVNAEAPDKGLPWWQSLLFGFGPTLVFIGLLVFLFRRMARAGGGALGAFGRSRAKRYEATTQR